MSLADLTQRAVITALVAALLAPSCKRRDETPPPQPSAYPPQQYAYPPQPGAWAPSPAPPPPMPPAFGFYCASDSDLQCPYGRCAGGRCGGCTSANDCKAGATCAPSPVGLVCWPIARGGAGGQTATPAPAAAPSPAPFPAPNALPNAPQADAFARARQSCVDRINQFRARLRLSPLARDAASDPCADEEARVDARANAPHGTFGHCGEWAQNACPNYPGRTPDEILAACLQQMFDEGPGGGHYENMTSTKYSRAFCGFQAMGDGRMWIVQDFK